MGQEIAVSPDGSTVYFSAVGGCTNQIESVPVSGGTPTVIASGVLPAISPDGSKLAYAQEPWYAQGSCPAMTYTDLANYSLAVRTTGTAARGSTRSTQRPPAPT
jgi:Tol biopolymer transport system component